MLPRQPARDLWNAPPMLHARRELARRDDAIVEQQIAISEIAAPTGEEGERASTLARRFRALGLRDVRIDEAGNVIGRRGNRDDLPAVVICAHLDTVFPRQTALSVKREGTRLVGPGIGDNGRGLTAMLALAEAIDGNNLRTVAPVDFVATTGEEGAGDLHGAKHLFSHAARHAACAVALDGAGDERIVHRALGSRRYRIMFSGTGGHSWTAYGVANPLHAAATTAAKLARLPMHTAPRTTLSVSRMGGGIAVNAIPAGGWLEVDLRSTSAVMIAEIDRQIRLATAAAEAEENERRMRGTPALRCTIEIIGERPTGQTDAEHPIVRLAGEATRLVGREPELATASTDANVPIAAGIPAIAIGAGGRGGDAHTSSEWFDNADGMLGIARALAVVVGAAGLSA